MKSYLYSFGFIAGLLAGSMAQAETYNCNFTEPFVSVRADSKAETISIVVLGEKNENLKTEKATFKIVSGAATILQVASTESNLNLILDLLAPGNDGMSDREYEVDATLNTDRIKNLRGGCDTTQN